jgi:hypothetical protein
VGFPGARQHLIVGADHPSIENTANILKTHPQYKSEKMVTYSNTDI